MPRERSDAGKKVENQEQDSGGSIEKWFYVSIGVGFGTGVLVPCLIIAIISLGGMPISVL